MFKVKLTSNFFISLTAMVALGVAGCGGSGEGSGGVGGGVGGKAGTAGMGGKGAAGGSGAVGGGKGGATPPGTGGVAGAAGGTAGGSTGGSPGTGGVGGGVAGSTGTGGGTAGAGGHTSCGETVVCVAGATRCDTNAPQTCILDPVTKCPLWRPTVNQPAECSANQTCVAATGTCDCKNDAMCGTPPKEGDFCPTAGAATHSACVKQADGCYTVTAGTACTAGQTCNIAAGMIVAVGTACGCPPVSADQTGATTKLLGTGCATVGARVGSAMDNAILICTMTGSCPVWTSMTSCVDQQLTGGTDPATGMPACVCKKPTTAGQYYVDPDPSMSTFMNGPSTGAQFPAACRFRTLTTAFKQPGVTAVVSQHESTSNVHFLTNTGLPAVSDCSLPNTCEAFPLKVPAGVHVYTADVGSFNPNHYVVDVDVSTDTVAVELGNGANIEGYTFDASGTTALNQGCIGSATTTAMSTCPTPISAVLATPKVGSYAGTTPALAASTAIVNQIQVFTRSGINGAVVGGTFSGQTGVLVRGQGALTAHYLTVVGGSGPATTTNRGIQLANREAVVGAALLLAADHLNVNISGGTTQLGVDIGVPTEATVTTQVLNTVTIANDAVDAMNSRGIRVGTDGIGVNVYNGNVTTTGLIVTSSTTPVPAITGYKVLNTSTPAAMGVKINSGTITGGYLGGTGVLALGGSTTITSTSIKGGNGFTGVSAQSSSPTLAGEVIVTGTMAAKTVIDTLTPANATATTGIVVGSGAEYTTAAAMAPMALAHLTINDHTTVQGYWDGLVINNGHVVSTGTDVAFSGNARDGVQILSDLNIPGTNPMDPLSRVTITGASITGNGRGGVLVREVAPVTLDAVKVTGNGTALTGSGPFAVTGNVAFGGIDVQRSAVLSPTTYLFTLQNSTVSQNAGCGVTLSGGGDDLVARSSAAAYNGARVCGFGGTVADTTVTAAALVAGGNPAAAAFGTVFGGPTNIGGKVSATLLNNTVQNNTGVGIYVTEARDQDPALAAGVDDVTEATIQGNKVTGNLTSVPATGTEPAAGGIYVAQSNWTMAPAPTVNSLGCEVMGPPASACTRVRMSDFFGNTLECNGRAQLSFAIPQRVNTTAMGTGWDISSNATLVGVTLADRCTATATPNRLAGYSGAMSSQGLVIPGSATDAANSHSLIDVAGYGVFWNSSTLASGTDYSAALGASGNMNAAAWGVCPGAVAVTCPVALVP